MGDAKNEKEIPLVHGRWLKVWNDYICSVCGGPAMYFFKSNLQEKSPFCPTCGAKMDLKKDTE